MAEPRRVEFQTISTCKEDKKETKRVLIPRFTLALGESTATTCPEFSFTELVKKEKKSVSEPENDDPFGAEDDCHDEVAALAQKLEEKYGPKPGKKTGKKRKLKCLEDEYFDLGDGYDVDDPFIDNTEAYDEVVPSCLTTKLGGFYINSGTLDFRTVDQDQEDSAGEFITPLVKKRGRPRKILDSDEDEPEAGAEPKKKKIKKKKVKEGVEGEQKRKKKKLMLGPDGEKIVKRKKIIDPNKKKKMSPTVKELLKQQTAATATPNGDVDMEQSPTTPPNVGETSTIQDQIESVIFETLQDGDDKKSNGSEFGPNFLPSDLPDDLAIAIVDIKQAARDSKKGKCKFFSPHVNNLLLGIELASRQLQFGKRKAIYAHLADHLPCGKETLIKRAKKLRESQQDDQLKLPIQRLKEEIDKVMPGLQELHEQEVARSRQEFKDKLEESQREEGGNTESDDDNKSILPEGQSRKGNRDPRKKFKWTSEIKSLLCQIVGIKMRMFDTYKIRSQAPEDYLKTFLDNEVKVLWPQGWIQTRMLYKETRSVHGNWTNPLKPKRPLLVSRSVASPHANSSSNICDPQQNDSLSQPPLPSNTSTEVIEVSDNDDPYPTPTMPRKDKVKAVTTVLDVAEGTSRGGPGAGENLKFSPNSMEAIAAATAAAVAAAVSSPKVESALSVSERRPNLVTEMLKKPGIDAGAAFLKSAGPKTPTTPLGKDAASFSPFLAEFNKYLTTSNTSTPQPSTSARPGPSLLAQHITQVQSKTVSSSTVRPDDKRQINWSMEDLVGVERARKLAAPSAPPPPPPPPAAHAPHPGLPLSASNSASGLDALSLPPVQYKKMAALLMGADSGDSLSRGGKSKSDLVRDQILSQIQAEIDARSAAAGGSSSRLVGEDSGNRAAALSQGAASLPRQSPAPAHLSRQSPVPPHSPRQSPVPAHSPNTQRSPGVGAVPGSRQSPQVMSRQSPTTVRVQTASGGAKQQAVVSPQQTTLPGKGSGSLSQGTSGRSLLSTFQSQKSPSQISPPPARGSVTVRPGADPTQRKPAPSPSPSVGAVRPASSPAHRKPTSSPALAHASQPFQRNSNTPVSQPLVRASVGHSQGQNVKVSVSQGQNMKASVSQGQNMKVGQGQNMKVSVDQGQNMKVNVGQGQNMKASVSQGQVSAPQRVSVGQSMLQRSSPTNLTSQGQRNSAAAQTAVNKTEAGHGLVSVPQGAQKLSGAASMALTLGQAISQTLYQQIENEVRKGSPASAVHNNRANPAPSQRPTGGQAATATTTAATLQAARAASINIGSQLSNQASNQGSKQASVAHSKPLAHGNMLMNNSPRPQEPSAVAGKAPATRPAVNLSGTSGALPHGSGIPPAAVEPPRPPQSFGQ
ncbi:ubinuclein-1-like isoform X2 [Littorina saxatilis]|uniref:ubinuclein-1-like isoform X2 n=1 Tax=Littorina saxatilis TaxID=31220 RepID=UPI0038B47C58